MQNDMDNAASHNAAPGGAEARADHPGNGPRNLRSACDACHHAKVRCSGGGSPCKKCEREFVPLPGFLTGVALTSLVAKSHVATAIQPESANQKEAKTKGRWKNYE